MANTKLNNISETERGTMDSILEMVGDAWMVHLLIRAIEKMHFSSARNYISLFVRPIAAVIVYETSTWLENGNWLPKESFFRPGIKKRVLDERIAALKRLIFEADEAREAESMMGIKYNEKVYDICIRTDKNNILLDTNYELFVDDIKNSDFWTDLFDTNRTILESIIGIIGDVIDTKDEERVAEIVAEICDDCFWGQWIAYSTNKLFNGLSRDSDRRFVMYRYRSIYSVLKVGDIISGVDLNRSIRRLSNSFFRKWRAVYIELIGHELMEMKTPFSKNVLDDISKKMDSSFYKKNRSLRNNIHYSKITTIIDEDEIDKTQYAYLGIVLNHMQHTMSLNVGFKERALSAMLQLASFVRQN